MKMPDPDVNSPKESLLDDFLILGGALLVLLTISYFGFNLGLEFLLKKLTPQQERKAFEKIVLLMEKAEGPQKETPTTHKAQTLLNDLVKQWPEAQIPYEVFVLPEMGPNAFAFPGGYIGVTQGLLDATETENELAFVLAHELGHFKHQHHLQGLSRAVSWAVLQMAFTVGTGSNISQTAAFNFFELFSIREHQRDQEREADAFGLDLVAKNYGHTRGAVHFFQKMKDQSPENLKLFEKFASSHPLPEERIEQLQKWSDEKSQNSAKLIPWKAKVDLKPVAVDAGPQ